MLAPAGEQQSAVGSTCVSMPVYIPTELPADVGSQILSMDTGLGKSRREKTMAQRQVCPSLQPPCSSLFIFPHYNLRKFQIYPLISCVTLGKSSASLSHWPSFL